MVWEHRIVKLEDGTLMLAEVHYSDGDMPYPVTYTEPFMGSETKKGLKELVARLAAALDAPVIDESAFEQPDVAGFVGNLLKEAR